MMESLTRSLNYELPQELHFSNDNVQHILQNSPSSSSTANIPITTITLNSTPAITATTATYQSGQTAAHLLTNSVAKDFLHKLGATLLNSIQLQSYHQQQQKQQLSNTFTTNLTSVPASSTAALLTVHHHQQPLTLQTDMDFIGNHLSLDTKNYEAMDELQKQLEYDKFMNEVWIGVVLTLIFISMIFCFCSCFLYHQFIIWKRNYRSTLVQSQSLSDIESIKSSLEFNDPVPEYTLVSGLPSYEVALELLRKTKQPCLLVHPSVFNIFEKSSNNDDLSNIIVKNAASSDTTKNVPINNGNEVTTPLLTELTVTTTHHHNNNHSSGTLTNVTAMTHVNEKSPQQQQQHSPGMAIIPTTVAAPRTLMTDKATHSNKLGAVEKCCKS